jgi:hypothetical protein
MSQFMTARLVIGLCLASILVGCSGKAEKSTEKSTETATEEGCGTDYGDPQKEFCVTLPAGFKYDRTEPNELYSEVIHFTSPDQQDGIVVTVGFTNGKQTYEEQLALDEETMKIPGRTVESTGTTKGDDGKWWLWFFTDGGDVTKTIEARAKAANGKVSGCEPASNNLTPAVIEACKSIRPFPAKS